MKSDLSFIEDAFVLSFPLPIEEREAELQLQTNLFLAGAEDTGAPWVSIAGEAGDVERPENSLLPKFILGMKQVEGTKNPAEAFRVGSMTGAVGVGWFPGVGVPGEVVAG